MSKTSFYWSLVLIVIAFAGCKKTEIQTEQTKQTESVLLAGDSNVEDLRLQLVWVPVTEPRTLTNRPAEWLHSVQLKAVLSNIGNQPIIIDRPKFSHPVISVSIADSDGNPVYNVPPSVPRPVEESDLYTILPGQSIHHLFTVGQVTMMPCLDLPPYSIQYHYRPHAPSYLEEWGVWQGEVYSNIVYFEKAEDPKEID